MNNIPPCFQSQIFSVELADELKKSIESLPRTNFFFENNNKRWGLYKAQPLSHRFINPHDSWFEVHFDINGEVIEENVTLPFEGYQNCQMLKKAVCVALKWMAEIKSWQRETRHMGISIMQHYNLQKGESTSTIDWHSDNSDHTLVILLDDETQWGGGDFLFKVENNLTFFQPKKGYGILFSNNGTQHCLEPLTPHRNGVERTILTLHEKSLR